MMRERTELHTFSTEDLERMVKVASMIKIVGSLFIGTFDDQEIRWVDGGCEVITKYREGDMTDVQGAQAIAHRGVIFT